MPLYEYDCKQHGVFEAMHSMAQAEQPELCPSCSTPSPRVLSAPRLACIGAHERIARDRNERSCHEPRLSRVPKAPATGEPRELRELRELPKLQASHSSRPWVLEHG